MIRSMLWAAVFSLPCIYINVRGGDAARLNRRFDQLEIWVGAYHAPPEYDVIAMGDSRTEFSVVADILSDRLQGARVLNYSFAGGRLEPESFRRAKGKFDPQSTRRMVVLGITPITLMPGWTGDDLVDVLVATTPQQLERRRRIDMATAWFAPVARRDLRSALNNWQDVRRKEFTEMDPRLQAKCVRAYQDMFKRRPITETRVRNLLAQVRAWREDGVEVYGFRPPVHESIEKLERERTLWRRMNVPKRFVEAGGIWITLPDKEYPTIDAVHLLPAAAREMTEDLVERIKRHRAALGREAD